MTKTAQIGLSAASILVAATAVYFWISALHVRASDFDILIARLHWWPVPLIFALLAAHVGLSAVRWALIEVALGGARPSLSRAFYTGALALGVGTFLPGPIANVACRSLSNRLSGGSTVRGAVSGGIDQIADLAVVLLFVIPATAAFVTRKPTVYLLGAVVATTLGWLATRGLARRRLMPDAVMRRLPQLTELIGAGLLGKVYALTLLRFVNLTAMTLLVHVACDAASLGAVLVAVPLVTLAISVAMLPGAIGISEWSFTGVLAGFGTPVAEITAFVLANRLILTSLGLLLASICALWAVTSRPDHLTEPIS